VVVGVVGSIFYRRWREKKAAAALESAIAQQGAQQALNARPERRAEIQELQKQVAGGIGALKSSKLGKGKGGSALYSLPWYVIIGPPGAGKTTALKHSGLVFPFQDQGGGGVRGVGGTRNCDWWFTNEAILLDTAGRYTTETDDRDEWLSFLRMLLKYRSKHPINGILVAIGVNELLDANESQVESTAKRIRARIDEVMTELKMKVPVYLLFTKVDLIAGFVEIFGDLRKSERSQIWGSTIKLDRDKSKPSEIFEAEFDQLVQRVHSRSLKRLVVERNREAREKIYQFPIEFAAIKRNLSELVGHVFQVNAFQGTPIFRGFYFTSGTQEGKPLDRVLQRMGHAMGIRAAEQQPQYQQQAAVESKSYFLYDLFMNVVFPDGSLAVRSEAEIRRQRLLRVGVSSLAFLLGLILGGPSIVSFFNNRAFLRDTESRAKSVAAIKWDSNEPANKKIEELKPLLERLQEIDSFENDGRPLKMGWFMYQADKVRTPSIAVYVKAMQDGFALPCKSKLEDRLKIVKGEQYLKERRELKQYLMLSDVENLDVEWATGRYVMLWTEVLRPSVTIPEFQVRELIRPHVKYYFELLKAKRVTPIGTNAELVERVRKTLQSVRPEKRYYDMFVNSLIDERYDETADDTRENRKFPPLNLQEVFADRPDVMKVLGSKRQKKEKKWQEVEGPYTEIGHYFVLRNIGEGKGLLEREQWVVPLDKVDIEKLPEHIRRVGEDYESRYIEQWTEFFGDIEVMTPPTVKEAMALFETLRKAEAPFHRLVWLLQDHTQWPNGNDVTKIAQNKAVANRANQAANTALTSKTGLRFNVDVRKINERDSRVPAHFRRAVEFAVPPKTSAGPGTSETPLGKYLSILGELVKTLGKAEYESPNVDPRLVADVLSDKAKEVEALLTPLDDVARALLYPLLTRPLTIGPNKLPTPTYGKGGPALAPPKAPGNLPPAIPGLPKR
jgi:type VI secretion system protein ImpL